MLFFVDIVSVATSLLVPDVEVATAIVSATGLVYSTLLWLQLFLGPTSPSPLLITTRATVIAASATRAMGDDIFQKSMGKGDVDHTSCASHNGRWDC